MFIGSDMDWLTVILLVLLIATLIAYFSGIFPYPFGWLILVAILIGQILNQRGSKNTDL